MPMRRALILSGLGSATFIQTIKDGISFPPRLSLPRISLLEQSGYELVLVPGFSPWIIRFILLRGRQLWMSSLTDGLISGLRELEKMSFTRTPSVSGRRRPETALSSHLK